MKLLYLEIENYGNLTGGRRIDFGGALQQFNEANGYGKTTLCSFIRVMFYGMKSRRENDTSFGDREHFYPFSGGRFGGSLTFFYAGKTCRIERFFDEKTATRDTFKYYENGAETAADGDKIGKEIFGLDEEAFIRALTFDAREAEIAATDGMKERLGAIAEGTAGGRNAAAAIEILEKRRKEICGDRKNADSELFRLDKERKKIGEEMLEQEAVARAADDLYAERARLKRDVAEAEEAETSLSGQEALEEKRARYEELVNQAKEAGEKRAEIAARYPAGLVTEKEIGRLRYGQTAIARISGELSGVGFSQARSGRLGELSARFRTGVPSAATLADAEESIAKFERQKEIPAGYGAEKRKNGGRGAAFVFAAAVSVLAIVLGLYLSKKLGSAAPAFCGCGAAAIIMISAAVKKPKRGENVPGDANDLKSVRPAEEFRATGEALERFFLRYGLTEGSFSERLAKLKSDGERYAELLAEKSGAEGRENELRASYAAAIKEIREIFEARRLRLPQDTGVALSREIERLSGDLAAAQRYAEEEARYARRAADYLRESGLQANGAQGGMREGAAYLSQENARARIAAMKEALNSKRKELVAAERKIEEAEAAAVRLDEKQAELAINREKTDDALYRLNIYRKTTELLRQADDSLMERYAEPVRRRFLKYAALLEKELGVETYMNRDFSLSFSRGGARRRDGHLSAGIRTVCALCLRLALSDEMFAGRETPFLLLDDPFVHLDEAHFEKTARLLRELSKDRQIVYFTCHRSRSVLP